MLVYLEVHLKCNISRKCLHRYKVGGSYLHCQDPNSTQLKTSRVLVRHNSHLGLFLNIKNENFGQNLNLKFLPQPPSEGGTKKMIFLEMVVEPKLQNSICRTHKERTKSKR